MRINSKYLGPREAPPAAPPPRIERVVEKVPIIDPEIHTSLAAIARALGKKTPADPAILSAIADVRKEVAKDKPISFSEIIERLDKLEAAVNQPRPATSYDFAIRRSADGKIQGVTATPRKG